MDIADKIKELVEKITKDDDLKKQFQKDPVQVVEKLTGKDLPDGALDKIVDGVKAKISIDKAGDLLGSVKGLFSKK